MEQGVQGEGWVGSDAVNDIELFIHFCLLSLTCRPGAYLNCLCIYLSV